MSVRKGLFLLVLVETLLCAYLMALSVGVQNTPQGTKDRNGVAMAFNTPLTREHYVIGFSNAFVVHPDHLPNYLLWACFEGPLLVMCGVGIWLLKSEVRWCWRFTRWFFALQILWKIPWLWSDVPLNMRPYYMFRSMSHDIMGAMQGTLDVESFVDTSVPWSVVYPIWLVTSLGIALYHWFSVRQSQTPDGRRGRQPSQELT